MNPTLNKVIILGSVAGLVAHVGTHGLLIASHASDEQTQSSHEFGEGFGIAAMNAVSGGSSATVVAINPMSVERVYFDNSVHFGIERNKMSEIVKF